MLPKTEADGRTDGQKETSHILATANKNDKMPQADTFTLTSEHSASVMRWSFWNPYPFVSGTTLLLKCYPPTLVLLYHSSKGANLLLTLTGACLTHCSAGLHFLSSKYGNILWQFWVQRSIADSALSSFPHNTKDKQDSRAMSQTLRLYFMRQR